MGKKLRFSAEMAKKIVRFSAEMIIFATKTEEHGTERI